MALSITSLKQRNNVILVITALLGIVILLGLEGILAGILGAIIIYVLFRPLNIYFQEKKMWNKNLSTSVIMIFALVSIIIPLFFLVWMITSKVIYFMEHPEQAETLFANINKFAAENLNQPHIVDDILASLNEGAGSFATSVVSGAANTFIQIIVMLFLLFFTLKHFREFESGLMRYMPFRRVNSVKIGNELRNMAYSNILGQGFIAIIQGIVLGLGFWIFGIPDAFFWAIIGTFLSMIPLFGSPILFVPAGIIELSNGNVLSGIGIILYGYLLVTTIDNFIRMAIGKKIANTHPLITVIGVVIGIPIFGIMGILYGPLIISLFIILAKIFNDNRLEIAEMQGEIDNN